MDFSYQSEYSGKPDQNSNFSNTSAESNSQEQKDSDSDINGISHTARLIKAASPYFDNESQKSLHFFAAVFEVMDSIQLFRQRDTVSAFSFSFKNVDFEGMLKGIRPYCNSKERSFVDKFISFFNMRRMFETYQNISSMMNAFGSNQDSEQEHTTPYAKNDNYYSHDTNVEDDFDYTNNTGTAFHGPFPDYLEAAQIYDDYEKKNTPYGQTASEHFQDNNIDNRIDNNPDNASNNQSESSNNQQMMDMLGSMLTPEQKSTFDAMKMLFDSGLLNTK